MFYIEKNSILTNEKILKILQEFQTSKQPKMLKWEQYYNGRQAILYKAYADSTRPCNHICTNYCATIANNYLGYITGNPIVYDTENEEVVKVLAYNDYQEQDKELLRNALIYGFGAELCWLDEEGKVRFNVLDSKSVIPVYYNTVERNSLACVIRFYPIDNIDVNTD